MTMVSRDVLLAAVPLSLPLWLCFRLLRNPVSIVRGVIEQSKGNAGDHHNIDEQLIAYMFMAVLGYFATTKLVPQIKQYTLRKGICGKDLGKRGTATATAEVPM